MFARLTMQWALAGTCAALAAVGNAQFNATSFGVYDSHDALIGRALDLGYSSADGSINSALFTAQFAGHPLLGSVIASQLQIGTSQLAMFEGAGCTGQVWISTLSTLLPPPFLLDPSAVVGTDNRVYVGSRADAAQFVSWLSFASAGAACVDSPGSNGGMVKATLVGSAPSFVGPFHLGPVAATGAASASVAAVTPAALAFLAALLLLTGIAILGRRARR